VAFLLVLLRTHWP